jgi:hypothetical protein
MIVVAGSSWRSGKTGQPSRAGAGTLLCGDAALSHRRVRDGTGRAFGLGGAAIHSHHLPCLPGEVGATAGQRSAALTLAVGC